MAPGRTRIWRMRMACWLSFQISPHPVQGVFIFARNAPKPENAAIAAFAFQSENGSIMLLVAPTRTIIFVEARRAGSRCCCCCCCVRRGKQIRSPVKKWQRGHRSYPFDVVTEPLSRATPLTRAATLLFRPDKHLAVVRGRRGSPDPCATPRTFRLYHFLPRTVDGDISDAGDNRERSCELRRSFVSTGDVWT
jgi:hypothetical protein